jgi:hypothetical protein
MSREDGLDRFLAADQIVVDDKNNPKPGASNAQLSQTCSLVLRRGRRRRSDDVTELAGEWTTTRDLQASNM